MTRRTLLITGANGFVGAHVAALAAEDGMNVWGVGREDQPHARLAPSCDRYFSADLSDEWSIPEGADSIVHLAGLAAVGPSFEHPQRYLTTNSSIVTNMCEALLTHDKRPRVVIVSSGAVYAAPLDERQTLDESSRLSASSPYAVAKMLVEHQSSYYFARGLKTVVARPFNHIGPGQGPGFLVPDLTDAVARLQPNEVLQAANLRAARDFTDVRDVAHAYLLMANASTHRLPIYNVASGTSHTGFEVLAAVSEALGRPMPEVEIDPAKLRPTDAMRITGNSDAIRSEFGWEPNISWQQSIADYVDHYDLVKETYAHRH